MHKTLLTLLTLAALVTPRLHAQEINLFNGRDLTGWDGLKEFWSVKDGAITGKATKGNLPKEQSDLVWQGGEVADFEFTCRFKLGDVDGSDFCNTGVYFRAHVVNQSTFRVAGYQADLVLKAQMPTVLGAFAGEVGSNEKMITKTGESVAVRESGAIDVTRVIGDGKGLLAGFKSNDWNECRVIAIGPRIQFFLNGKLTSEAVDERRDAPRSGLLALQLLARKPMIAQFKDLKLKRLQASQPTLANTATAPLPTTTVAAPTAIQTDPNQPRIDVLKDQAPNAIEWALAPLEQAVPGDIRQNLTFLREDLLDEGKQQPKASAAAYTVGSQICNTMLAALEERNQTLVRAGFRAVEANARTGVTSQALEARRNYKMSWPQFAREESQRAELKSQALGNAAVMAERPKVEWATRTTALRQTLDTLYAQFREALRQTPAAK